MADLTVRRAEGRPRFSKHLGVIVVVAAILCVSLCTWALLAVLTTQRPRCSYLQEGADTYLVCS